MNTQPRNEIEEYIEKYSHKETESNKDAQLVADSGAEEGRDPAQLDDSQSTTISRSQQDESGIGGEMVIQPLESESKPVISSVQDPWYPLVIGEMKFRLQLAGVFSIDVTVPSQNKNWLNEFYDTFENKYWKKILIQPTTRYKWLYHCLICGVQRKRRYLFVAHLNKHLGFYIARCQKCGKKFFSLAYAKNHRRICVNKV